MPTAEVDGLRTYYEVAGSGPALLMFAPGGFDAVAANWDHHGIYRTTGLAARLREHYTCIAFDRREAGRSGGRVERITWADYVVQGKGLLDQLGIERTFVIGGCVGCSTAAALAVAHPGLVAGLVLYSPAGGPHYRMGQHARFGQHLAFVAKHGLAAVVELARSGPANFSKDPRVGPWVSIIRGDDNFAERYAALDPDRYTVVVTGLSRGLFDRDTVPGVEPEDLMGLDVPALIVPGQDRSHATSAARYLQECLPRSAYWDVLPAEQTADTAPARVLDFLDAQPLS